MKRPSHATVVAYLALFVALGGTTYAATQLPKNSVGSKQLKKNAVAGTKLKDGAVTTPKIGDGAVTSAKIAAGAVTGEKVAEASLAQVPSAATAGSAATATSATTAGSAANAAALDGIPSSGFLRTSNVGFGTANVETGTKENILLAPGKFQMTTTGDNESRLEFEMNNLDTTNWYYLSDGVLQFLGPGGSNAFDYFPNFQKTIFAVDGSDPTDRVIIDCALATTAPSRIYCSARVPPAA